MVAPTITIRYPWQTSKIPVNQDFVIDLNPSDVDGDLRNVRVWDNTPTLTGGAGILLADINAPGPYKVPYKFTTTGTKKLAAAAYDSTGLRSEYVFQQFECVEVVSLIPGDVFNTDGSLNEAEYKKVAQNADYQYKLGPRYNKFHPTAETFPNLTSNVDQNYEPKEWRFWKKTAPPTATEMSNNITDWYAKSGNLVYRPAAYQDPSIIRAAAFSVYNGTMSDNPESWRAIHYGPFWVKHLADSYVQNPDRIMTDAEVVAASGGNVPYHVADIRRSDVKWAIGAAVAFTNGIVAVTGTGNDRIYGPYIQLPAGKVPMALTVSPHSEFIYVATWDIVNYKGELAVIAVKGRETTDGDQTTATDKVPMYKYWGLPNILNGVQLTLKLLGFVDLGIKAPTSLTCGVDVSRWDHDRSYFSAQQSTSESTTKRYPRDLSAQADRDMWAGLVPVDTTKYKPEYHKLVQHGYVAVASRSENKVVLVDTRNLVEYFRIMHTSTQANHDATLQPNFPPTFSELASHKPVVAQTLSVSKPSAIQAGFDKNWGYTKFYSTDNSFRNKLFIATEDGDMQVYDVGSYLVAGPKNATLKTTIPQVGKNICHIITGRPFYYVDTLQCTSRGDRKVVEMNGFDHSTIKTLRDERIQDPVCSIKAGGRGPDCVEVCDAEGKAVHTYSASAPNFFGYRPWVQTEPFEYCLTKVLPGAALYYTTAEVN